MSFVERPPTATPSTGEASISCSSCPTTPEVHRDTDPAEDFVMVELEDGQLHGRFGRANRLWSPRVRFHTSNPEEGVDIAMGMSGLASAEPVTVPEMMQRTVSRVPRHAALRYKTGETWNDVTYRDYYNQCLSAAKSFVKVRLTLCIR